MRLSPFVVLVSSLSSVLTLSSCEEESTTPRTTTTGRSQAVLTAPGSAATPQKTAPEPKPSEPATPRGPLCAARQGPSLPTSSVGGLGSRTMPFSGGRLPAGQPVWVNLWAAWCEPCKKEIPLLKKFQKALAASGTKLELVFLSLDDDERQLRQFLDGQSADGLRRTFWLREGKERDDWLSAAGVAADPRLPVHLLFGADGRLLCRIEGSIEEGDFSEVEKLWKERP